MADVAHTRCDAGDSAAAVGVGDAAGGGAGGATGGGAGEAAAVGGPPPSARGERLERADAMHRRDVLAGLRVLLIDDDRDTREAIGDALRRTGVELQLAASAKEGMGVVDCFEPQVILCDIAMPREDGYAFIRSLRARARALGGQTPALALTALASLEDRRRALEAGFQLHLTKPIAIDRLVDAVLELFALWAARV